MKNRRSSINGGGRQQTREVILTYSVERKVQTRQLPPPLAREALRVLRKVLDSYELAETDEDAGLYFPAVTLGRSIFGGK